MKVTAVLFDLDGTLLDTAPDLYHSLNQQLKKHDREPVSFEKLREVASQGSPGMIKLGFGFDIHHEDYSDLRQEFLKIYSDTINNHTAVFEGAEEIIGFITSQKIKWGIVTNKPAFLTDPLLTHYPFAKTAGCVVSGDTLSRAKPYPDPLLHACEILDVLPEDCLFVGDGERDMQAGKAAGMITILARFGYIGPNDKITDWKPDHIIDKLDDLRTLIRK